MTEDATPRANIVALAIVPGVMMLVVSYIDGFYPKSVAGHFFSTLAAGLVWYGVGRRWLQRRYASEDRELFVVLGRILLVHVPVAVGAVAIVVYATSTPLTPQAVAVAGCLSAFWLWAYFFFT